MYEFCVRLIERALGIAMGGLLFVFLLSLGQPYMIVAGEKAKAIQRELEQVYNITKEKMK